jgi:hypothetical protein
VVEREIPVNQQVFVKLLEVSATAATWQVMGTVDYGHGMNQLFLGNLAIPRPSGGGPVPFGPVTGRTELLYEAVPGRVDWFQIPPVGSGEGTYEGPDDAITSLSVRSEGLQWNASKPDEQGTLTVDAKLDTDGDLIPDEIEVATGTDPESDDSDGDGLRDGTEDADQNGQRDFLQGETDPRLWDTDGDGISDGVEKGLTSPEGNDTDPGLFRKDQEPGTTTDPTRADSDQDGLSDGEEDTNHDGRFDPDGQETSPLLTDSDFDGCPDWEDVTGQPDCNQNGISDVCDIASGTSRDDNGDGIPDSCQAEAIFRRLDADVDGTVHMMDALTTLGVLFMQKGEISCEDAADANDDGMVDISDVIFTLGFLFLGRTEVPLPGPTTCGRDPTPDALRCEFYPAEACGG